MGVSSFVKFLFTYQRPNHKPPKRPKGLYFDLNSLLHDVASLVYSYGENKNVYTDEQVKYYKENPEELDQLYLDSLVKQIEDIINLVGFTDFVWIGIDGVAPIAKIQQQRWRRYKSKIESIFGFSSVMLSPGTEFMDKIDEKLKSWTKSHAEHKKLIYNDTTSHKSPGEAEHKIFKDLMTRKGDYVIYGLDNDLVILSLLHSNKNLNIYNMKKEIETKEYYFVDSIRLKSSILQEMGAKSSIEDFVLMSFFIGNDFIPALFRYNLDSSDTLRFLLLKYVSFSSSMKPIIVNGDLDWKRFNEYLKHLEIHERPIYKKEDTHSVMRRNIKDDITMDFVRNTYDAYLKETFEAIQPLPTHLVNNMCNAWFKIVHWNLGYYYEKNVSNDTFYPYYNAPMVSFLVQNFPDILEIQHIHAFNMIPTSFLPVNVQMACILPPKYINLVKDKEMFMKIIKQFPQWFPTQVEIDRDGLTEKNQYMEKVLLPLIQPSLLRAFVSKRTQFGLISNLMNSEYRNKALALLNKFDGSSVDLEQTDEQVFNSLKSVMDFTDAYGSDSKRGMKRAADVYTLYNNASCKKRTAKDYLDIGCNIGENTIEIKKIFDFEEAHCIDVNSFSGKKFNVIEGISYKSYDGVNIPYEANSFDLVTILQVLHHVRNIDEFMMNLSRVVRKGGLVILREHDCPNTSFANLIDFEHFLWAVKDGVRYKDFKNEHYAKYFDKKSLISLFQRFGFEYCRSKKELETPFGLVNYYYIQFVKTGDVDKVDTSKMYKGALLHVHFSAAVRTKTLLDYIYEKYPDKLYWNYRKHTLSFTNRGSLTDRDKNDIKKYIETKWKNADSFDSIGTLFFDIIKNVEFYPEYVRLIEKEMIEQNIDHIELRLKIGSMFQRRNINRVWSNYTLPMEDEIELLYKLQQDMLKRKKSFVVIAQSSKHKSPSEVGDYFRTISEICNNNPKYRDLIVAFDIVGDESKGRSLDDYEDELQDLFLGSIPFVFHAGEIDDKKALINVDFALQYGSQRIGHGVYAIRDNALVEGLKQRDFVLEFCPLSMVVLKNMKSDTIEKLVNFGLKLTINSDDPNKMFDYDLNDNFKYMADSGFTLEQFQQAVWNSIEYSFAPDYVKNYMAERFNSSF